jgi:exodeoxyribonuclease-1
LSFVIYDVETTGLNKRFDQILHFGAVRTDEDLVQTARIELQSRLLPYVVPSPKALLLTGVSLKEITDNARPSYYEMVCEIQKALLGWSPTVFLGYNSIRFDEEFLRQAFYQCLHPTFLTNTNRNARADVLNLMRAVAVLRPGILVVPRDGEGRPVFRLADLAAANGLTIRRAHDAMHDVELTLQLCQRVREGAPDVWSSFMRFASKAAVVDFIAEEPVFGYFDSFRGTRCVRPLTLVAVSPSDRNLHYCLDLTNDIGALRALSDDELAEIVGGYDSPVRKLKVNASPFLCPLWELDHDHLAPSDEGELTRLAQSIQADEDFIARLTTAAVSSERIYGQSEHVELQIYGKGWPSDEDIKLCRDFHASPWEHRLEIAMRLTDTRLRRLGRRLVYFERPDLLRDNDRDDFDAEVSRRVRGGECDFPWMTVPRALEELDHLMAAAPAMQHGKIQALRDELLAR